MNHFYSMKSRLCSIKTTASFCSWQDEALKETIFELDDDLGNKTSKKKRGEVLRAKALTERKLAICRSAIEKNNRSIKLGRGYLSVYFNHFNGDPPVLWSRSVCFLRAPVFCPSPAPIKKWTLNYF